MSVGRVSCGAFIALALVAASPVSAQEDDDECGGILTALSKSADALMKAEAKSPQAICAGMGQVLGLARAAREVADQCMEEGPKRSKAMQDMTELTRIYQAEIQKQCN